MNQQSPTFFWKWLIPLGSLKFLFNLLQHSDFEFHRDELLYLALGQHLDWGFWSNPPLIGFFSFVIQWFSEEVWAFRIFSGLLGAALVFLVGKMAYRLGGGLYAQIMAGFLILISPAFTRAFLFFMPVPIEIFFWPLLYYWMIRYLQTENQRFLWWFGVSLGLAFLNKYSVAIFLMASLIVLAISRHRKVFKAKQFWMAAGVALLIAFPNLIWQYNYNFPIVSHMSGLVANQLVHVDKMGFIIDQLIFHLPALFIWLAGLIYLLRHPDFRVLAWHFIIVISLFFFLSGKSYYTLGVYPLLMAAGGVAMEYLLSGIGLRSIAPILALLIFIPVFPIGIPFLSKNMTKTYLEKVEKNTGVDAFTRWEDGQNYELPQDFADMIGWKELAAIVEKGLVLVEDIENCLIYCENYGQAGALVKYGSKEQWPEVVSLSDTYRLWAKDTLEVQSFIYVNDELGEDVAQLFEKIVLIDSLQLPLARERGTRVYLLEQPRQAFAPFWASRIDQVLR